MPTTTPFPAADLSLTAATPNRKTRVLFGLPEYRKTRQSWGQNFVGYQMAAASGQPAGRNLNVTLLPSGSWCISSWEMQMQFERQEAGGTLIVPPTVESPVDFAPGFETFVSQSTVPGVNYDPSIVTLGCYWCRKRKAASGDWHAELTTDRGAFIPPLFPTTNADMRRIAHQQSTFPPNQGVYLRFMGPGSPLATTDAFLTFYFGGDTGTIWPDPANTTPGGNFALTLFGDGGAWLQERTNLTGVGSSAVFDTTAPWRILDTWQWEVRGKIANQQHVIIILPEGRDTLNILGTGRQHLVKVNSRGAGYTNKIAMTGDGSIRLDMREDLRLPFQFGNLVFPVGGAPGIGMPVPPYGVALYGYPFKIPYRVAAGAKIFAEPALRSSAGAPTGTVNVKIYDAKTKEALPGPDGGYAFDTLHASQRDYYPVYTLGTLGTDSTTNAFTPFLDGCNFRLEGQTALFTPTPFQGGQVMEVAITGPDVEIDCEHASVLIEDEQSILADGPPGEGGLEQHADTHVQIRTQYDPNIVVNEWVLFDGVLVQATGVRVGKETGLPYPSSRWKTWRIELAGQWHRLAQPWQVYWHARDFTYDPSGIIDPATGHPVQWRIIDILTELFKQAGFDESQIFMTNPPGTPGAGPGGSAPGARLFADLTNPQFYWLNPGTHLTEFIQKLAHDYLGAYLIWDKEALPHGRWITVYPPALSGGYSTLYTFRTQGPPVTTGTPLMPVHMPAAYPTGTTFVTNYSTWVEPPQGNLFIVYAAPGAGIPAHDPKAAPGQDIRYVKDGAVLSAAVGVNWRSTNFEGYEENGFAADPTSLDFVPYGVKPVVIYRPDLYPAGGSVEQANEACRYFCRRLMNAGAYGLRHFQWLAPLIPYFDPDDVYGGGPRTFRTGDLVTFNEDGTLYTVFLKSCNPQIGLPEGDLAQWAEYTGYALPIPLSY